MTQSHWSQMEKVTVLVCTYKRGGGGSADGLSVLDDVQVCDQWGWSMGVTDANTMSAPTSVEGKVVLVSDLRKLEYYS